LFRKRERKRKRKEKDTRITRRRNGMRLKSIPTSTLMAFPLMQQLKRLINSLTNVEQLELTHTLVNSQSSLFLFINFLHSFFLTTLILGDKKIKIYINDDGSLKGDALVSYVKIDSVDMALELLHKAFFRPGHKISVESVFFPKYYLI
jgi:hypothetical protein